MSQPGNSSLPLVFFYPGSPVNVLTSIINPPIGSFVIDYSTPNLYQKTSAQGDNSGYNLIATGSGALTPSSVRSTGGITTSSPTAGLGYATGAGGAVTQATNKSTGVTLGKIAGAITMNNAALADATTVSFIVTDAAVAATDNVLVNHVSGGTAGAYVVSANNFSTGFFSISVRNVSGGSLSEAIVLQYSVVKSVAA